MFIPNATPVVILAVSHDGTLIPHYARHPLRRRRGFWLRDRNASEVAWAISHESTIPIGVVRGKAPRWMVDLNRPPDEAFDHPLLRGIYTSYHQTTQHIIEKSIKVYGREECLFLDIHGFKNQPPYAPEWGFDIILGTANRRTILYDDIDRKLGNFLAESGYSVYIPEAHSYYPNTTDPLRGDKFTVLHYSMRNRINSIQLEISQKIRGNPQAIKRLALAINNFLSDYYSHYMDQAV